MIRFAKHSVIAVSAKTPWIFGRRKRRVYWTDGLETLRSKERSKRDALMAQCKDDLSAYCP